MGHGYVARARDAWQSDHSGSRSGERRSLPCIRTRRSVEAPGARSFGPATRAAKPLTRERSQPRTVRRAVNESHDAVERHGTHERANLVAEPLVPVPKAAQVHEDDVSSAGEPLERRAPHVVVTEVHV